ncbi:MAG: hypothetical protein NTZ10_01400 [Candidatus Saganbacteria bacterium]|nr:hypothetical protein [Candidatus Saganbacteria bacterium]
MAKPVKYAPVICTICSIIAGLGVIIGLIKDNTIIIIMSLLPAIIYEAYRTEGKSTIWASWAMLGAVIAELICVYFNLKFDLARYLGSSSRYIAGYNVPLGDIQVIFPSLMAILAVILFVRTNGIYTRWLSVIIFTGSFAIVWTIDSAVFQQLFKFGMDQGLNRLNF